MICRLKLNGLGKLVSTSSEKVVFYAFWGGRSDLHCFVKSFFRKGLIALGFEGVSHNCGMKKDSVR